MPLQAIDIDSEQRQSVQKGLTSVGHGLLLAEFAHMMMVDHIGLIILLFQMAHDLWPMTFGP